MVRSGRARLGARVGLRVLKGAAIGAFVAARIVGVAHLRMAVAWFGGSQVRILLTRAVESGPFVMGCDGVTLVILSCWCEYHNILLLLLFLGGNKPSVSFDT